ncbi:MAG: hypothetical protein AAF721_06095 [Myxococcota bacterium]
MTRFIAALATATALAACHPGADDVAPTDERAAEQPEQARMQAKRITIEVDGLDRASIQEIAEHIEGIGDIASAKVKVMQDNEGHAAMHVEVAGTDLPTDEYLLQEIRSFDGLADAEVAVQTVHPDDVAPDPIYSDKDKSPEEIKAEVTEQLRQQGIEGDVQVKVIDDGNGERRVEVNVSKDEEVGSPSDLAPAGAN